MRDLFKILVVGVIMFVVPSVSAEEYRVLVLPDNIVSNNDALDSYVYSGASEFFANEVINILNGTNYIKSPTVSEERALIKKTPAYVLDAKSLTSQYKNSYLVDYTRVKKIANLLKARYVLLLTTSIDAENYILRRTVWDFCNIPGATVVDPAYKVFTYATLVDTQKNVTLWSNNFQKTISVVENRIISRGPSPQLEQMNKIKDYSRMRCPEIAQNVQLKVLPPNTFSKETNQIYYDMGNFDNVFTKKYRRWGKEGKKLYKLNKTKAEGQIDRYKKYRAKKREEQLLKQQEKINAQLEVIAEPIKEDNSKTNSSSTSTVDKLKEGVNQKVDTGKKSVQKISPAVMKTNNNDDTTSAKPTELKKNKDKNIHDVNCIKQEIVYPIYDFNLKQKKHNLYGTVDKSRPDLRDYQY